jgi:hypothetical protein
MGNLDAGEKELHLAQALKPDDPDIERVLRWIALARSKGLASQPGPEKTH